MQKVDISPAVALKEAQAELAFLRNRCLILAQAVAELQQKLIRPAITPPAAIPPETPVETPAAPAAENPA